MARTNHSLALAAATIALGATACTTQPQAATSGLNSPAQAEGLITGDILRAHVAKLSSDDLQGRGVSPRLGMRYSFG